MIFYCDYELTPHSNRADARNCEGGTEMKLRSVVLAAIVLLGPGSDLRFGTLSI